MACLMIWNTCWRLATKSSLPFLPLKLFWNWWHFQKSTLTQVGTYLIWSLSLLVLWISLLRASMAFQSLGAWDWWEYWNLPSLGQPWRCSWVSLFQHWEPWATSLSSWSLSFTSLPSLGCNYLERLIRMKTSILTEFQGKKKPHFGKWWHYFLSS